MTVTHSPRLPTEAPNVIPLDAVAGSPPDDGKPRRRGLRGLLAGAAAWGELRNTPYGMTPALIFGFASFFQILDTQAFVLAGPDIIREFEINIATVINISRVVAFFGIFAALGVGWYADRHRRVPLFVAGTIMSGVTSIASAGATSTLTLGTPRVLDDVANIAADVPSGSLLADYYPIEARGRVFAMLGTMSRLGAIIALPAAGLSITYLGLRPSFVLFGIPITLMGIVAAFKLREPVRGYFERRQAGADEDVAVDEDQPQSFGEAWRTVWAVRTLRRLFFSAMIGGAGSAAYAFYGFFLVEEYGLSAFERGLIGVPVAVVTLIGGFLGGGLVDTFSRHNPARVLTVVGLFNVVASFGIFGIALGPPLPLLVLATAVFGFGSSLVGPALGAIFSQVIPPNVRTQGLQMTGLALLPALLFFTPIALTVREVYGYTQLFLLGSPFFVLAAIIAATAGPFFDIDRRNALAQSMAQEEWRRARAAGRGKLLVCRDVDVEYNGVQVLFGVDFDVEEGSIVALLGTNGAGKSTLLRAISGSQEASSGAIIFDGRDITHMPPHEIAARSVIAMPGGRGVFPGLTVRENLVLGAWMVRDEDERRRRLQEVDEIFPVLAERANERASSLSGGEQQMLSLAQAFLAKPKLLMIDELSLGLSPAVVGRLLDVVRAIRDRGVTVIVVEQSVNVALTIADKAIFMEKGEVKFVGETADLLRRPDILRAVYVKGSAGLGGSADRAGGRTAVREGSAPSVLEVDGIEKRFGGVVALDGVGFGLAEGQVLGIIGPNGSGKTTMFDVISGYQRANAGTVRFEGRDIGPLGPEERARLGLVRRFQDAALFPSLTVSETILLALHQRLEVRNTILNAVAFPQARRAERRLRRSADRLIELFDLGAFSDKFVRELSTGLRRVVDLACVMATEPKVLLLDEPSSGIAQAETEGLAPLLRRVKYETNCSILIIEHDMPLISSVSDELLAMANGRVLVRGLPDEVLDDDRVIESYLGGSPEAVRRSGDLP